MVFKNLQLSLRVFGFFVLGLFIASCVHNEIQTQSNGEIENILQGTWDGKIKIEDFKNGKTDKVDFDLASKDQVASRMDVTGPFSISLASMYWDKNLLQLLLHREKKAYEGKPDEKSFEKLIQFPVNPDWITDVLFNKFMSTKDWNCDVDFEKSLTNCKHARYDIKLVLFEKTDSKIYFSFANDERKISIMANRNSTKVQSVELLQPIKIPSQYKNVSF